MKFDKSVIIGLIAIIAAVFLANKYNYLVQIFVPTTEKLNLKTEDRVNIAVNLYSVYKPHGWLLLIHMMPATKESWRGFASELQKLGYESIAIDLRGHGGSDGGPDGYKNFSDAEHQASIQDLEAAWEFLKSRGAEPDKTVVIGASIGANLSLQFLIEHPEISGGVLLSPGNYKGIDSGELVKKMSPNQKIIFAASKKDERSAGNNAVQNQGYYDIASQVKNRRLILFERAGHGTELLDLKEELDLTEAIMKFLKHGSVN